MNRPLSYFKDFKVYDENGNYCGSLKTILVKESETQNSPVEKIPTNKGPHRYIKTADTDKAIKWIIGKGFDVQFNENMQVEHKDSIHLKHTVNIYKKKISELIEKNSELTSQLLRLKTEIAPPLQILKSKREILDNSKPFKPHCGIYFLIQNNEIVYIGQSVNIEARVGQHWNENAKSFSRVAFILCAKEDLNNMESLYIDYIKPKYNGNIPISKDEFELLLKTIQK